MKMPKKGRQQTFPAKLGKLIYKLPPRQVLAGRCFLDCIAPAYFWS